MSSYYHRHGRLSQRTMDAFRIYDHDHQSLQGRLNFYVTYLWDVVPEEVTVHLIPDHLQRVDLNEYARSGTHAERKEIRIMCDEGILMTGIVQQGHRPSGAEDIASHLAHTQWRQGFFVRFLHQAWGMFTGLEKIRFYSSRDATNFAPTGEFHPINHAREVAAYFQREYSRVRRH